LLIDVRAYPGSRRHPQFNRDALENFARRARHCVSMEAGAAGRLFASRVRIFAQNGTAERIVSWLRATWSPGVGRRAGRLIREARREAARLDVRRAHPSRCHRRLISDWLASREIEVEHLIDAGAASRMPDQGAVVEAGLLIYPGAAEPGSIPGGRGVDSGRGRSAIRIAR